MGFPPFQQRPNELDAELHRQRERQLEANAELHAQLQTDDTGRGGLLGALRRALSRMRAASTRRS